MRKPSHKRSDLLRKSRILACTFAAIAASVTLQAAALFQEAGGVLTIEAEHFETRVAAADGQRWAIIPDEAEGVTARQNARNGAYIQSLPDQPGGGNNHNQAGDHNNPPYVDYRFRISTAGEYRLWLRWNGYDGSSDSLYAHIREVTSPGWYRYFNAPTTDFTTSWAGDAAPDSNSGAGDEVPALYNLSAGTYTLRVSMREDGSAVDTIVLQLSSRPDPTGQGPSESALVEGFILATQPANQLTTPGGTATFTVNAMAAPGATVTYQWQQRAPGAANFTDIPGATSASYTTPTATDAMNGTQYRVVATSGGVSLTSSPAVLTTDAAPPTVRGAFGGANLNTVTIRFSEGVNQASAETVANYTINGLTVSAARLQQNGTDVVLTTGTQTAGTAYTATINGVRDFAGNATSNLQASFAGATRTTGGLRTDLWFNIPEVGVDFLLADPRFPNSPEQTTFWPNFGPFAGGNNYGDNFGAQITGWIVPPVTGDYKFYLRSDDASQLFLSTDDRAANEQFIAEQSGCCNAFTDVEGTLSSAPVALTAGREYWVRALLKEGGGDDYLQVGWRTPNDADLNTPPTGPIAGSFLRTIADPTGTVTFTQQPTNVTVAASNPVGFTVGFDAFSAFGSTATVQWQRAPAGSSTFTNVPGATSATFNIPFASPTESGAQYRAVVTAAGTSVNSTAATLTVSSDTTPPELTSVNGTLGNILVGFSEPLEAASAGNRANYQVSDGVTVNTATLVSAPGAAGVVRLDVAGATAGGNYTLTVNGVRDASGNTIAASTRSFSVYHLFSNFDDGAVPADATLNGSANIQPSGSYNGTAFVELTPSANSLQGTIVYADVLNGADASRFTVTWKMFIGDGSGNAADGVAFAIGSDLESGTNMSEEGSGTGVIVSFDTYDNGGGEAPAISVKYGGTAELPIEEGGNQVIKTNLAKAVLVNNRWVDVAVQVTANGRITVIHDNVKYFDNVQIPDWAPIAGPRVAFGGRTGGEREANWLDDIAVIYNADVSLPQPPTISITSPANNATVAVGSPVTINVNAQAPGGNIAKVEFFANGQSIGSSTTAPYSFTVPAVPQGAYLVTAAVTDARGVVITSAPVKVIVGTPPQVLYVHGGTAPSAADPAIINGLLAKGLNVVTVGDTASQTSDATGKALVIISSTVGSGNVNTKFRDVAVPLIQWEQALQDDLLMTTDEDTVTRGTTGSQTDLNITNAAHPMAAGLTGNVTVTSAPATFTWGAPGPGAQVIATMAGSPTQAAIYVYEKGATLIDGTTAAPDKRIGIYLQDATFDVANDNGRNLVNAAINYALGQTTQPGGPTVAFSRSANQLTLTWSGGGSLEAAASVLGPWTAVSSSGSFTTPLEGAQRFFRVRQ